MGLDPKFIEWACSLSGCDGGNPNAEIWICGIEWGYSKREKSPESYYNNTLVTEIKNGAFTPSAAYNWMDSLRDSFGLKFAKLYSSIKGETVAQYKEIAQKCNGQEIFKLNLYPIAFNTTDHILWHDHLLSNITGFKRKELFIAWCFKNRFPIISRMVPKYNPKLIIGTGITYLTDFFMCFAGETHEKTIINYDEVPITTNGQSEEKMPYYWAKLMNGTFLVVIPSFSGRYGLKSDEQIQKLGEKIRFLIV